MPDPTEAPIIITIYVAPDCPRQGTIGREPGESDARYAQRKAVLEKLFGLEETSEASDPRPMP